MNLKIRRTVAADVRRRKRMHAQVVRLLTSAATIVGE